jgi:hypothetical protein
MQISNLTNLSSMIYSCNVYLVQGNGHAPAGTNTLVDVGSDPSVVDRILHQPNGRDKKLIEQVILTHSHFDHSGILDLVREKRGAGLDAVCRNVETGGSTISHELGIGGWMVVKPPRAIQPPTRHSQASVAELMQHS